MMPTLIPDLKKKKGQKQEKLTTTNIPQENRHKNICNKILTN